MSPQPVKLFGLENQRMLSMIGPAVVRSASRTCSGVNSGRAERTSAAVPAVNGVASDVPLMVTYDAVPDADAPTMFTPGATTSGLIRPSFVGPVELNAASCFE